jgi:hypothetical protein
MIRYIMSIFFNESRNLLGRWYITKNQNLLNIKIDQSNIDHCGVCFYEKTKDENKNEDEYYKPFFF